MENYQDKVAEFMRISGQLVASEPRQLTKEELDFRDTLLREEIRELQYAIVDNNRVEILDALCDIVYVALGTCNSLGIKHKFLYSDYHDPLYDEFQETLNALIRYSNEDYCIRSVVTMCYELARHFKFTLKNFEEALDRVNSSNMSKFCLDTKTAERTQQFYKEQGIDTYIEPKEKVTVVYRQGDGKVLKSIEYHPVYLADLV